MKCCILTLFPDMFPGVLGHSVTGNALEKGLWSLSALNLRDFGQGKHAQVDDTPYGGGAGMVMKPDVIASAIDAAYMLLPDATLIYLTPRGSLLTQATIEGLMHAPATSQRYIFLCGRFEGIDQRVLDAYQPLEISIGDYVLCGGELAAMVMIEAMLRYVPGVLGNPETHWEESFTIGSESACLLEYPHYTKPPVWNGRDVPEVLTSGNHARIASWRRGCAEQITQERRPDLWERYKNGD
jgi:tRNA (guanine37-N1)-methyltransferase